MCFLHLVSFLNISQRLEEKKPFLKYAAVDADPPERRLRPSAAGASRDRRRRLEQDRRDHDLASVPTASQGDGLVGLAADANKAKG